MGKQVKHSERKHALLSASGASRWLNCTPSPRIAEKIQGSGTSSYAAEGTLAHEFGELGLQLGAGQIDRPTYNRRFNKLRKNELYSLEMPREVEKYTSYILERFAEAKTYTSDAVILIEKKVDLTEYIENGFGTDDVIIIAEGKMIVADLKYGKGIKVIADDNPQLKLYALGALVEYDLLYGVEEVELIIVQPRLDHISTWSLSAKDLYKWGDKEVRPKAKQAYAGEGLQQAGDWCKWCPAAPKCATLASKCLKVAKHSFKDPHLLSDDQLTDVLGQIPILQDWAKKVSEYMFNEALKGKTWKGFKLVEGRSVRKWKDENQVAEALRPIVSGPEEIYNTKLKGIGDIEKLIGKDKFSIILEGLIIKPPGKPTLVHNSDKRPAFGIESAKKIFETK